VKNRLVRVRELLQRELGAIIARDHAFPSVLVTVNDVDITPDLKHAYFYIGVIGPEHEAEQVVDTLNRQRGELQTRVSKRVILKNTPHFHFRLDHSVERGVRVTGIMETIDRQLAESAARDAAAGTGTPASKSAAIEEDEEDDHQAGDGGDGEEEDADSEAGDADEPEDRTRSTAVRERSPRSRRGAWTGDPDA